MTEWIVSSSLLIVVVLAVRTLCKNRLGCRARYALWLLVLARLLIPAQLFATSWGLTGTEETRALAERMETPNIYVLPVERTQFPGRYELTDEPYPEDMKEVWSEENTKFTGTDGELWTFTRYAAKWSAAEVLRAVWLAGALVMALALLVSNLRFARRLGRVRAPIEAETDGMKTYVAEGLTSPCLVGLFRPAVYLTPEATSDERTLRHVLAHETTHKKHGDCIWSALRLAALCLHWYNPLAWLAVIVSKRDGELACDEATLARLGEGERAAYGETLLMLVRVKPNTRELLSASTAMTAGKKSMRERIETIARHPRTKAVALLLAVVVLLTATAIAFSKREQTKVEDASEQKAETDAETPRGDWASVEDYLDSVRAKMTAATYYAAGSNEEKTANVEDTRVAILKKEGELDGLAPDGTLELYSYLIETKLEVPAEEIEPVGGMYVLEDGWCDLEGQGGHSLVVLRRTDGSVDVLFDRPNNDDRGGLYYYEDSAEEMLYDFYVKENGLDLPLYTIDLFPDDQNGNYPAHRVNRDDWYIYVPVQGWYRADDGDSARWFSSYNTGSSLSVRYIAPGDSCDLSRYYADWNDSENAAETVLSVEDPETHEVLTAYLHRMPDGGFYQVFTRYDLFLAMASSQSINDEVMLEAMAESFTMTSAAAPEAENPADTDETPANLEGAEAIPNFARWLYNRQPEVTLSLYEGGWKGGYDGSDTSNGWGLCYGLTYFTFAPSEEEPPRGEPFVRLESLDCTLDVYRHFAVLRDENGVTRGYDVVSNGDDYDSPLRLLREWYDEAEYDGLGGYDRQSLIVVPDRGQTYLEAAQEHCEELVSVHQKVSSGSKYRYTFVRAIVHAEEEQTAWLRGNGAIDENTWCVSLTIIFVPENEAALNWSMAGNTDGYAEYMREWAPDAYDPSVPEDAYICGRVGYVTKDADGWHTDIVGTGW